MKLCFAWILSFYVLFCAVVPCSALDRCEEDNGTEQHSGSGPEKGCDNCSPFSICAAVPGFTFSSTAISLIPVIFYTAPVYNEYYFIERAGYYSSHFQPPRIG